MDIAESIASTKIYNISSNKLKSCITNTLTSHTCADRKKGIVGFRQTKLRMINTIKTSVKTVPMINLYCSFMFRTKHLWLFLLLNLVGLFVSIHARRASVPLLLCFVCCFQFYVLSFWKFAFESIRIESNRTLFDVDVRFIP